MTLMPFQDELFVTPIVLQCGPKAVWFHIWKSVTYTYDMEWRELRLNNAILCLPFEQVHFWECSKMVNIKIRNAFWKTLDHLIVFQVLFIANESYQFYGYCYLLKWASPFKVFLWAQGCWFTYSACCVLMLAVPSSKFLAIDFWKRGGNWRVSSLLVHCNIDTKFLAHFQLFMQGTTYLWRHYMQMVNDIRETGSTFIAQKVKIYR